MQPAFLISIAVLLCCFSVINSANNDENMARATKKLTTRYIKLFNRKTDSNNVIASSTAFQYMREVQRQTPDVDYWLEHHTGIAAKQLSWPPEIIDNLNNKNFLKLALAFHRLKSVDFRAKSMDLQKLYRAYQKVPCDKTLPSEPKGLDQSAQAAIDLSEHHKSIYFKYGEALGQTKEMLQLKFPMENRVSRHKNAMVEATIQLRKRSSVLLTRCRDADEIIHLKTAEDYLECVRSKNLGLNNWLNRRTGYTAQQLSGPPKVDEATKKIEFLVLAIAFNNYQSLRYKELSIELDKLFRHHNKLKAKDVSKQELKEFKQVSNDAIKLSEDHDRLFLQYQQDLYVAAQKQGLEVRNDMIVDTKKNSLANDLRGKCRRIEKKIETALLKDSVRLKTVDNYLRFDSKHSMECWVPNETSYSAELLSTLPDQSNKYEQDFLEEACSLNRYKSLWYKLRFIVFDQFARHNKGKLAEKCKTAAKEALKMSEKRENISKQFQKVLCNCHSEAVICANGAQELEFYQENNYDEDSDLDSTIALDFPANQHETETNKRMRNTLETSHTAAKRRKFSSQTDDHRITADVESKDAYGSTSKRSSERDDCLVPHFITCSP